MWARVRWQWLGLIVAVLLVVYPPFAGALNLRVLTQALFVAYLAGCWNLAGGYAGRFSLGHSALFGIGGYTSTLLLLRLGLSPFIGMWVGAVISAALAAGISALTVRYQVKGMYFALMTMAFSVVVQALVSSWGAAGGSQGLLLPLTNSWQNFLFANPVAYYYVILVMVAVITLLTHRIAHNRIGRYFVAIREDEAAAEASGVNTAQWKAVAMALSGFLVALGGTFSAQYYRYASPQTLLSFDTNLQMLLGTMVGGAGTVFGPVVGAAVFNVLSELLRSIPFLAMGTKGNVVTTSLYAVILIFLILYLPGGLAELFHRYLRPLIRPGERTPVGPAQRAAAPDSHKEAVRRAAGH